MENDNTQIRESEFNSSVATLMRLDEIKKHLDVSTVEYDPDKKYFHLLAFWIELDPIISETEQKQEVDKYQEVTAKYNLFTIKELDKLSLWAFLVDWEMEMRRIDQRHNLNMKMGRDKRWVV